jgi:hypothetical protein
MDAPSIDTDRELRAHIDELIARDEITTLVHRLGASLDEGRFDDMRAIFTADATAKTPGGVAEGIDALTAQASRNHAPDVRIQHVITDVLIDLDGDSASVRANLVVTFAGTPDGNAPATGTRLRVGEVYRFTARRAPDGWRLASVESVMVWASGQR